MSGPFNINGLDIGGVPELFSPQPNPLTTSVSNCSFALISVATGLNIESTLTTIWDYDVPVGAKAVIVQARLSNMTSISNLLEWEIDIDGVTIFTSSSTLLGVSINLIGSNSVIPGAIANIIAKTNITIRAKKPGTGAATGADARWYLIKA